MNIENNKDLLNIIKHAPVGICILDAATLVIEMVNDVFVEIAGKPYDAIYGKYYWDSFAEAAPYYEAALASVVRDGTTYRADEVELMLIRQGKEEWVFVTFVYEPVKDENDVVQKISIWVLENTQQVKSRQMVQNLNEELATTNKELSAANEELAAAGEDQIKSNHQLAETLEQVEIQRGRLNHFLMQAPAGICVLEGPDLVYELVNPEYQKLLPGRDLLNRPIFEALPELVATPLQQVLLNVFHKSQSATFTELLIPVAEHEGEPLQERYFTFHYVPRQNEAGITDGIMAFVYEVTQQARSRQMIEQLNIDMQSTIEKLADQEGVLQIALTSASMGLWQIDLVGNATSLSDQMKRIHGIPLDIEITFEEALLTVAEEFRTAVNEGVVKSIATGELFSADYLIHPMDGSLDRWVRSWGNVNNSEDGTKKMLVGTCMDITEQKQNEQRKNDFIGMVSHEMKTPLTSLNGYLQLLQTKTGREDAFAANMLTKATKQINRMTTLINGFLNVSRLESGKIHIDKKRFDMALLVKEAEDEVQSTINSHKVVFAPVITTWVNADRDKINQVISNLIGNAVKYSPANTVINVACKTVGENATVSVTDEGIGIKQSDQPKLFDRYYRVNNDNMNSASGFGIGLYLCAEIIMRHDGKIWVESEVGKGSTFSFSLPVIK